MWTTYKTNYTDGRKNHKTNPLRLINPPLEIVYYSATLSKGTHNADFTMESKCINYPFIYSFFDNVALYLLKKERGNTRNQV
jgi:hypothetical protein